MEGQTPLEAVHRELFALLTDVVRVLEEEQLPYSLICGTLLGAVRHGGFIPWDDDIDLLLPRESYERFAALYAERAKEGFRLDTAGTWVPRVRRAEGDAFVDLFILDPLPSGTLARAWKLFRLQTLQGMLKDAPDYRRFSPAKRVLLWGTRLLGKPFPKAAKLRAYRRIARGGKGRSRQVHMSNGSFHLLGIPWAMETFAAENLTPAAFEGLPVRVPKSAADVLTRLYGPAYMTPPPENQRAPLHLDL